jgi:dTDP-4-dehydrorhamnose reductase
LRVAVTGAGGLLGTTLVPLWRAAGADVTAWTRSDVDVTDRRAVDDAVRAARPEVVLHGAAFTDVDGAEDAPDAALRVNEGGTAAVAAACAAHGAAMIYVSSDYVFGGTATAPIPPDAPLAPAGAYARSKAAGEAATRAGTRDWLIVRTGWVFGPGGKNFVDTMRQRAQGAQPSRVVNDQHGAPTSTAFIAEVAWRLVSAGHRGVWHVTPSGATTWFGVAQEVYRAAGADASLVSPCSSAELARRAPRPAWSVLDSRATAEALGQPLPPWQRDVDAYVRMGTLN